MQTELIQAGSGMLILNKSLRWTSLKSTLAVFAISEIARRLRVTGYPAEKITETSSLEQVLKTIENQDCKHAYILATYTAMLEFRELLVSVILSAG